MRKKWMTTIVAGCVMLTLSACAGNTATTSAVDAEAVIETETNMPETEMTEVANDTEETDANVEENTKTGDYPVMGEADIEGYEGFTYLYDEVLMTESEKNKETGKMESQKLTVYIPEDEYVYVNRGRASVDKLGVSFSIELNPYLQYKEEDYLLSENLEYLLEENFDPFDSADYKDLIISDVEELGDHAVRATVEYCKENYYGDDYETYFKTYYVKEIEPGFKVLVEVEIIAEDTTGKTQALLDELEKFYEFEINWDKAKAEQKKADYLASGGDQIASTGFLLFELPEGWNEDKDYSDYSTYAYAPDGDSEFAGCTILFMKEYMGSNNIDVRDFVNNKEQTISLLGELMGDTIQNVEIKEYGSTCLGEAVVTSFEMSSSLGACTCELYLISDNSYIYIVQVVSTPDALEDPFVVARDILENGEKKSR